MIKRDSARDFAIFKTPSQYQSEYNNGPHVDDETICFVSDTGKIYTHGHEFGGKGATYTGEGGININSSNVISIDTNWLRNQNLGGGGNYAITNFAINNGNLSISQNPNIVKEVNLSLGSLSDVNLNGASNGKVLKYNGSKWVPSDDISGDGGGGTIISVYNLQVDIAPESIIVVKNGEGKNKAFSTTIQAVICNNGQELDNSISSVQITKIVDADGNEISQSNWPQHSNTGKNITISAIEGQYSSSLTVSLVINGTVNGAAFSGIASFNIYLMDAPSDSNVSMYKIVTSVNSIHRLTNNNNRLEPNKIYPVLRAYVGTEISDYIDYTPTQVHDIFDTYICYQVDDDQPVAMVSQDFIETNNVGIVNKLSFCLDGGDGSEKRLVETLYVTADGRDAIEGAKAIFYGIQVESDSLHNELIEDSSSAQYYVKGNLTYQITRTEGTDVTYIEEDNPYNITTVVYIKGEDSTDAPVEWDDNLYSVNITEGEVIVDGDPATFAQIVVLQGSQIVATTVVPIRIDPAQSVVNNVQYLQGVVLRVRTYQNGVIYNDGFTAENGVYYQDIVKYGGAFFLCKNKELANQNTPADGTGSVNPGWQTFTYTPAEIVDILVANKAWIESLTSKQIVITDSNDEVVAGMVGSSFFETPDNTDKYNLNDGNNGIRIWAGPLGSGGNVAAAPFTVDEQGHLKAIDADLQGSLTVTDSIKTSGDKIKLNANGSGQLANGSMSWDETGNILLGYKEWESNGIVCHQYAGEINTNGSGSLANRNIQWDANGNLTINGTLNYNEVIGNVEEINITASNANSTNTIKSNTTFAIITDTSSVNEHKKIYFPQNPQEGKTLFVMGNGSLLNIIPSGTDTAFVYTHNNQGYTDDFGKSVYKYTKHTINSSYNPDIYTYGDLYVWTGNDVSLHQYIYHSGTWYELTTFSEEVYSRG